MSDFPRGWTLNATQLASGVAPSVTVAATPGVVHVLDSLTAKAANFGSAGNVAPTVSVVTSAGTQLTDVLNVPGSLGASDSLNYSGLDISSSPNGTLVVSFSGGPPAGYFYSLTIQGHDI